ncbi:FG-GAP-like repeat-containing protein [Roseiconus lacunae]|uniref:FG-GAP-like repeat-containing protein n=1 Tax=Roseiconus lacunae TaxID=2605694 RepID=UPI00309338AB|nr:FG-GAP-like repeat-containing protein [Stieleria sp. HD01]
MRNLASRIYLSRQSKGQFSQLPDRRKIATAVATVVLAFVVFAGSGCDRSAPAESTDQPKAKTAQRSTASSNKPKADADVSRDSLIERVETAQALGDIASAESTLQTLLVHDPSDAEVLFRLATIRAEQGQLGAAIELLAGIDKDDPEAGLPALGQSAAWCIQLGRYDDAERRFRQVLEVVPDFAEAHRQLAYIYNRQGRRHEAAAHLYELCRQGNVRQDELHALIVLSDAMTSDPTDSDPNSVDYSPIGAAGLARQLFSQHRYPEAADVLRDRIEEELEPPSIVAFYGRVLAEAQLDDEFARWLRKANAEVRQYAEFWAAMAIHLGTQKKWQQATRAALEALDRDPTDFRSINRLHLALKLLGRDQESQQWEQRWKTYKQVLTINNAVSETETPNIDAIEELASQLFAIDRKLEAVLWKSIEAYYRQGTSDAMNHWNQQRQQLVQAGTGTPDRDSRLLGMKLDSYPMPDLESLANTTPESDRANTDRPVAVVPATFSERSQQIGLDHRYQLGPRDLRSGFTMYHQTGGGVAVTDYDLDGWPDLYFAQGAAEAPDFVADTPNQLYRSQSGQLHDVTRHSHAIDHQYTIGCTSGDWNQDGFPDIVTSNIGTSYLWLNQGDGSFRSMPLPSTDSVQQMPSSIAIADLNRDHVPDLIELNYLNDPAISLLPERQPDGAVIEAVGPADFAPAADRIGLNDGAGGVQLSPIGAPNADHHHGLGVVITDFDGKPGNEIFVGNDKSANQFWILDDQSNRWADVAPINGTAFSYGGAETASMGIAAADFDQNGAIDLQITNFQNESVCLYLGRDGAYQDRAFQYRLGVPSRSVLGFGTQAIDYDNNGLPDLVVTNGHIDDYVKMSGPYRQQPQLFANLGDRFELAPVTESSVSESENQSPDYWNQAHLGRSLAMLDFNRDGRNDFVITHMADPSAILVNETKSNHHCIQLQLIGVESERDAIGAKVTLYHNGRQSAAWVTAGDGYLCKNEAMIAFGLGQTEQIDRIEVLWPSGKQQSFSNVPVDCRLVLTENAPAPFLLHRFGATDRDAEPADH